MSGDQEQFLNVIDRDEAERRFRAELRWAPLGEEVVALDDALGRVLARDVLSAVDVPSFDRSNYDGFAVRAADTFGALEHAPRRLRRREESIPTGAVPRFEVAAGEAAVIATGGMLPRGADAVAMVEHADVVGNEVLVSKAVSPGFGVSFAGTDIGSGELVLRRGEMLTSRETGVLAAIGVAGVRAWRQPVVAILSTGDEILAPGEPMRPGLVYDSNARVLADAVRELGGRPLPLGVVRDDLGELRRRLAHALEAADVVLLSGGTSKGAGDLSYRAVAELRDPGIVAHGVALKPGKPICLAASRGKPVAVLPGFPTSAIFTFHEFIAPVLLAFGGRAPRPPDLVSARMAVKVNSEVGRTEYLLVGLVPGENGLAAFPMGKGSGSVTAFSRADGFIAIDRHREIVDAGTEVRVQLLGHALHLADLVAMGSHCSGLDYLLGEMQARGWRTKFLALGSQGGLQAVQRGECDLAGIHLLDAKTGEYNRPFVTPDLAFVPGYGRRQGVVFRAGDARFRHATAVAAVAAVIDDPWMQMVNRNAGSGTRLLIDRLLGVKRPPGYAVQPRNHQAVCAAIVQGRADWGVAIETAARHAGLEFLPLQDERYDFVAPASRLSRPAVRAFCDLLCEPAIVARLRELGFQP